MVFIETLLFTKILPDYLSDDEYQALQVYLMEHPNAGIIRGSGGVRKVRWAIGKIIQMKHGCLLYTQKMKKNP